MNDHLASNASSAITAIEEEPIRRQLQAAAMLDNLSSVSQERDSWVLRFGHGRALLLLTLASTLGSVLVTLTLAWLLGLTGVGYLYSGVIGTIVPMIMVPLTMSRIIRLTVELGEARAKLHYMATHDSLTSTYNRSYFMSRFEAERRRAQKIKAPLSIMMIDVDEFKSINDCYGHIGGDIALEAIARAIRTPLRPQDTLARYGGEEFIVLLPETALDEACAIAERLRRSVSMTRVSIQEETIAVTVSIGLSSVEQGFAHVIDRADAALYEAKRGGRNRWAC
ncbi:GGDEF domain-containing protein [Edaphobacter flagellatus]|uniref:GGDEF domain-containing protein n=1 Tax=Edaphobacter flagellatus TaxID=1933044 RepID=UPI0021B2C25C|nr:GGDEF domain-containing protein [Edaphobacter flagellatus]